MRHAARRVLVLGTLAVLALLLGSAPAWAHSQLERSDPAAGTSLASGPKQVSLTFNEAVQPGFTAITVVGPDKLDYHSGTISEVDDTIAVGVQPLGPAGTYQIGYRIVSADGHPVSGSVAFTLTAAGPGSPAAVPAGNVSDPASTPGSAPPDGGGPPVWPWIVGAVVLVAGGVVVALRLGRS
ncbi:copper resistance CopC family protein [Pseudonocardia sp. GCM10023141]|uniref:copper resistance CopC family protein n=1 Tax=Pseudonocardia sp. GCM10023141 TaxID=3252653 RepID=UPI003608DD63